MVKVGNDFEVMLARLPVLLENEIGVKSLDDGIHALIKSVKDEVVRVVPYFHQSREEMRDIILFYLQSIQIKTKAIRDIYRLNTNNYTLSEDMKLTIMHIGNRVSDITTELYNEKENMNYNEKRKLEKRNDKSVKIQLLNLYGSNSQPMKDED